jgi:hypothetical protein
VYYSDKQDARCESVIDQAITFIKGVGGQLELEAIRSRVKEAMRDRVKAGFSAGGRCYGYRNERIPEGVDPKRARTRL